MASYTFIWPHPASEVYVTGTFDNWIKSEKLSHTGSVFEKTVTLSKIDDKILYKFVVDGNWTTDHMAPSETDSSGNVNNVLLAEHLTPAAPTISSVAPGATTTALAGQVPIRGQSYQTHDLPGQFPVTPAETAERGPDTYSVNPLPATSGAGNPISLAAGEKVPQPTSDINSNVKLDQASYEKGGFGAASEQTYSVNPLPATAGTGNPIALAPGEKVPEPSSFTSSTLDSNVRLDQASYEKSGSTVPQLPPVLSAQEQREAEGAAIFAVPAAATISSVGPSSTTAALAGQQPLQSTVPEIVSDSQHTASVPPEASSSPTAVADKAQLEDELKAKVPEAPSTAESGTFGKSEGGILGAAAAGIAAAGAAVAAGAYAARDKLAETSGQDPTISSVAPTSTTADLAGKQPIIPKDEVPVIVLDSQAYSKAAPEASASPQAVQDKAFVESELKDKVPEAPTTSESGVFGKSEKGYAATAAAGVATAGAVAAGAAYAAKDKLTEATSNSSSGNILPVSKQDTDKSITQPNGVPEPVVESQALAHASPEAASNAEAVKEKSAVEQELLTKVPESSQSGAPAPSSSAALSSTAPVAGGAALGSSFPGDLVPNDAPRSGDVSPFSNGSSTGAAAAPAASSSVPSAAAGNGSAPPSTPKKTAVAQSSAANTPSKSVDSSPADSKKKRRSFFSKLKEKLKN